MFDIIVPPNSSTPTRRAHQKSKNGCMTCKERKLKCDEVKPVCGACYRRFSIIKACNYAPPVLSAAGKGQRGNWRTEKNQRGGARPLAARSGQPQASGSKSGVSASQLEGEGGWETAFPVSLSAEMLDPFATHPKCSVSAIEILMKQYLRNVVYKTFPWQPPSQTNPTTTYYVPLVWSDPVLFHATLQLTALRVESMKSHGQKSNYNQLAAESIRLLRTRIEHPDLVERVSDTTISAVATLAAIEHERSNMKMLRMHIDGLKRMVAIRGGLGAIRETNPMVANSVFWMFVTAIYEVPYPEVDPILPPFFPVDHGLQIVSHFQDLGPAYAQPPPLDLVALGVAPPVATIIKPIQHVSQLAPRWNGYTAATTHLIMLTRMCTLLSHLLSLPPITVLSFPNLEPNFTEVSAYLSESARFAICLHVFSAWRGLPPDGTLTINSLMHRLIATLKSLMSARGHAPNTILLWIFAAGGVSALNLPERVWFVSHLAEMTEEMGITDWEGMKAHVSRGIWHERLLGASHRKLWDEVEAKREIFSIEM